MLRNFSVIIICKNEERVIKRCIESIQKNLKKNDEIIVVDTGSTDNTIKIISSIENVKLFNYEWKDDFADARNFGISKAKKDWIFFIDSDEIMSKGCLEQLNASINEAMAYSENNEKLVFSPKAVNTDDSVFYNAGRIFANDGNIKYEGCVHEYPIVTDKSLTLVSLKLPRVIVRHDGYEKEVRADKNKTVRNITLIKKILQEEPNNSQYYYYYYRDSKPLITIEEYEQGMLDFFEKFPDSPYIDQVVRDLAYHYIQVGKNELAEEYIKMLFESAENGAKENYHLAILYTGMNEMGKIKAQQKDILKLLVYAHDNVLQQEEELFDKGYIFDDLISILFFQIEEYETAYKICEKLDSCGYASNISKMISKLKVVLSPDSKNFS
ncbi:glycosyltransferase family 2 protein [Enterococcus faecalis]|uniref:glycosyltransferase family 2 protein n=1 Tax=Enterococcus faecalis TaxID=1351 RepID=UPI001967F8C9|nr:glycosyltransferase family 2 protein [Enterococcus faecalis]MBN3024443.1 glycosyltransferase family 2 protein [Enterococcus faecalis]MBO6313239.1 glycosyltransferase family 2 protein [Enterococcus faecalis]